MEGGYPLRSRPRQGYLTPQSAYSTPTSGLWLPQDIQQRLGVLKGLKDLLCYLSFYLSVYLSTDFLSVSRYFDRPIYLCVYIYQPNLIILA